jgi:hypothetical protein
MAAVTGTGGKGARSATPIVTDAWALQCFLVASTIVMLPLHWALGTELPWIFLIGLVLAFGMVRFSLLEWQMLALAAALSLSLLVAMMQHFQGERAFGAVYNIAVLVLLVVFINFGRQLDHAGRGRTGLWPKDGIYRAALFAYAAYVVFIVVVTAYASVSGQSRITFNSLILGNLGELPGILGTYAANLVVETDWINGGTVSRNHGMGVYATESAIQVVMLGAMGAIYLIRRRMYGWAFLVELSILPMLIPFGSRTTGLAYVASLLFLGLIWRGGLLLGAVLVGPFVLAGLVLFGPDLLGAVQSSAQSLADARAGSTETRLETYKLAVRMVLDHNLILGLGIKPVDPSLAEIPIGSHSSVVSTFTRAGLIGLGLFLAYYFTLAVRVIAVQLAALARAARLNIESRLELAYLGRAIFVVLVWYLTEDLDVPLYHTLLSGLIIGIFWNMSERLRHV